MREAEKMSVNTIARKMISPIPKCMRLSMRQFRRKCNLSLLGFDNIQPFETQNK